MSLECINNPKQNEEEESRNDYNINEEEIKERILDDNTKYKRGTTEEEKYFSLPIQIINIKINLTNYEAKLFEEKELNKFYKEIEEEVENMFNEEDFEEYEGPYDEIIEIDENMPINIIKEKILEFLKEHPKSTTTEIINTIKADSWNILTALEELEKEKKIW